MKPLRIRPSSLQLIITVNPTPLKLYITRIFWGFLSISILSWALFALAWGINYRQEERAHALKVRIFDLESANQGGLVGPALRRAITQDSAGKYHLGWQVEDQDPLRDEKAVHEKARELVLSQKIFAAVVVAGNATSSAVKAWTSGQASAYDADKAATWYYEEARSRDTVNRYVVPEVSRILQVAMAEASRNLQAMLSSNATEIMTSLQSSLCGTEPTASLSRPFWYTTVNLRPFDIPVASIPTSAGGIYLIVFTYFLILFFRSSFEPLAKSLTWQSEIIVRLAVPAMGYLWLSLSFSLVSVVLGVPFYRWRGEGGWWIYWMVNWFTQMALGFPLEFIAVIGSPIILSFALLTTVVVNVVPISIDLADTHAFYRYAKGLPLWNQVEGSKHLIFGTRNLLGMNFGIWIVWIIASLGGIVGAVLHKRGVISVRSKAQRSA